mmetsp:Transcript_7635/g.7725  ORF Transcript_7635/g.7725 Transcript_7635/m.7725 type:complete len:498 (+) Transcript_7635:238-1731(+)
MQENQNIRNPLINRHSDPPNSIELNYGSIPRRSRPESRSPINTQSKSGSNLAEASRRSSDLTGASRRSHSPVPKRNASYPVVMSNLIHPISIDEFGDLKGEKSNRIIRTGRQRKKVASRSKGGEFQQKRKKRRVYFCCVSNEIDIEQLHDTVDSMKGPIWRTQMYEGVLHLYYKENTIKSPDAYEYDNYISIEENIRNEIILSGIKQENEFKKLNFPDFNSETFRPIVLQMSGKSDYEVLDTSNSFNAIVDSQTAAELYGEGGKEVFVFDFGAVVFWGFHRGEEEELLIVIREHCVKGCLSQEEFSEGQDDIAFVISSEIEKITIEEDVITLPDYTSAKSRLSVSFAIAQSAVLAIFEARIESKTEGYRYIPEALAARGKVKLSAKKLGGMIGEVYVIRHDVNLHSEILDTPDFFWKEDASIQDQYMLTVRYLEMENRTEILNKRLDMLRELLCVLQQQHENAHAMKMEWIVIWLIIISVVLEVFVILLNVFSGKNT